VLALAGAAASALSPEAITLRGKHEILRESFAASPFHRPLLVQSSEAGDQLTGDVYAIVEHPFQTTVNVLRDKAHWCEVLMLHLNIKRCRTTGGAPNETIAIVIGRKVQQVTQLGQPMEFRFKVGAAAPDFLSVELASDSGPFGTHDHRLTLHAAPLDARSSFVHFSYSYSFGGVARLATQAYLATLARDKVGFTVTSSSGAGQPIYIQGVRGMVERNAMRYYLAIEAYVGALSAPPAEQQEKRLRDWFALTERNATQLHEIEREEYLTMKRRELQAPP